MKNLIDFDWAQPWMGHGEQVFSENPKGSRMGVKIRNDRAKENGAFPRRFRENALGVLFAVLRGRSD
jgi:hypothetical protein